MKKRLDQYTVAQFIDIACGDYTHIDADGETAKDIASTLMEQYNHIADPVAARAKLLEDGNSVRSTAKLSLFRILLNLMNVYGAYAEVKDILIGAGLSNVARQDGERLKAKVEQLLRTEEGKMERSIAEKQPDASQNMSENEFRTMFDKQTAKLMAHFKFSINHDAISASVYANLVNEACRQAKQTK